MTFKRNFKYSYAIFLIFAIAPIIAIFYLIFTHSYLNFDGLLKGTLLTFAISGMIWIPGILLHLSYYFNDKGREVRFGKNGIEITKDGITNILQYDSISRVEKIVVRYTFKSPWADYGFVKINTKNANSEKITCLLIDPFSMTLQLARKCNCKIEESIFGIPFLFL